MQFNLPEPAAEANDSNELQIGNVYKAQGQKTAYWVVLGLDAKMVTLIGINKEGIITSGTNYGRHVFENNSPIFRVRQRIGFCSGLEDLAFNIEWDMPL